MIKVKDTSPKPASATRTISLSDVQIVNGCFVDEEGNIADRVAQALLSPDDTFSAKIKISLDEAENE